MRLIFDIVIFEVSFDDFFRDYIIERFAVVSRD